MKKTPDHSGKKLSMLAPLAAAAALTVWAAKDNPVTVTSATTNQSIAAAVDGAVGITPDISTNKKKPTKTLMADIAEMTDEDTESDEVSEVEYDKNLVKSALSGDYKSLLDLWDRIKDFEEDFREKHDYKYTAVEKDTAVKDHFREIGLDQKTFDKLMRAARFREAMENLNSDQINELTKEYKDSEYEVLLFRLAGSQKESELSIFDEEDMKIIGLHEGSLKTKAREIVAYCRKNLPERYAPAGLLAEIEKRYGLNQ